MSGANEHVPESGSGAIADLTPDQRRARERIEGLIAVMAPALDLILAAGERISRITDPEDDEHYAVRSAGEPALLEAPHPRSRGNDA